MQRHDPDQIVSEFVKGRLSRRNLIAMLMAIGATAAGVSRIAGAGTNQPGITADDDVDTTGEPSQRPQGPTFSSMSIDHLALNVTDIPRSRDWYMRHLGMTVMRESRTSSFLRCAGGTDFLALFRSERPGMHHFSFAIPDYDPVTAAERLREAGLTPKPRGRRMYFDDPDGIEVQVSQAPATG